MQARTWRLLFLAAVAGALALLLVPLPPAEPGPPGTPHLDKVVHLALFAAQGFTGARAFPGRPGRLFAALVALGAATELAQAFVPGRSPGALDLAADAVGALAAFLPRRGP